jgi:hypothetical protein
MADLSASRSPPWREAIEQAIEKNKELKFSKYVQLVWRLPHKGSSMQDRDLDGTAGLHIERTLLDATLSNAEWWYAGS